MPTLPELLARACGETCSGPHRCFYCGAPANESFPARLHVKDSFNDRPLVARPSSPWVCRGCVLCLREDCEVAYPDRARRRVTKAAMRTHSWVITNTSATAATKAHLAWLRGACLSPPEPPYAISLADSGQKQLLYRGVVCGAREHVLLTLEAERIGYRPADLDERLHLCARLIAATGKPALAGPPTARFALAVCDYWPDGETLIGQWENVYGHPLTRLAAWLSPGRDEARARHPAPAAAAAGLPGVPPAAGRTRRPRAHD